MHIIHEDNIQSQCTTTTQHDTITAVTPGINDDSFASACAAPAAVSEWSLQLA